MGPLNTRRLSILPAREMTASTTTDPSTPAALAIAGYTGRIGASSIPSETPFETRTGPTLRSGASDTAGPCPSPIPIIPIGKPTGTAIPGPAGPSGGGSPTTG